MRKFLFLGASLAAIAAPAWGQEAAPQEDDSWREVLPPTSRIPPSIITVTASGNDLAITSTGQSVTVINASEIDRIQGGDISRVLQRVPGLTLTRNGGVGAVTGVNIRGANSDQLLVLVDGVPVSDAASPSGGFDMGNITAGMAGSIDITRSSNSTIWGSDAMGGVMNISSRGDSGYGASAEYGSNNTIFLRGSVAYEGDKSEIGISGVHYETDGFSSAANGTEADGFVQHALSGYAKAEIDDTLSAFARGEWSKGKLDMDGYPAPEYTFADTAETQETTRYSGSTGLDFENDNLEWRAAYSLSKTSRDNFDPAMGDTPTFASDGTGQQLTLRAKQALSEEASLAFGGEYKWSDYHTASNSAWGNSEASAKVNSTGGYAQLGWEGDNSAMHLGARLDDHQRFGTHVSLGADVNHMLSGDWRLRASYGEGFKAPSLYQLYSDYGDANLKPEESVSYDLGIQKGIRGRSDLYLALTAYRRDSKELIGWGYPAGKPWGGYINTGRARAQGVEAEVSYNLFDGIIFSGVYSFLDAKDRTTGKELARRPKHSATLSADWVSGFGLSLGADLRIVSASFDDAFNSTRLGGYQVADLRGSFDIGSGLEIFARVENAFDEKYQTVSGYATQGRAAFVGVRFAM